MPPVTRSRQAASQATSAGAGPTDVSVAGAAEVSSSSGGNAVVDDAVQGSRINSRVKLLQKRKGPGNAVHPDVLDISDDPDDPRNTSSSAASQVFHLSCDTANGDASDLRLKQPRIVPMQISPQNISADEKLVVQCHSTTKPIDHETKIQSFSASQIGNNVVVILKPSISASMPARSMHSLRLVRGSSSSWKVVPPVTVNTSTSLNSLSVAALVHSPTPTAIEKPDSSMELRKRYRKPKAQLLSPPKTPLTAPPKKSPPKRRKRRRPQASHSGSSTTSDGEASQVSTSSPGNSQHVDSEIGTNASVSSRPTTPSVDDPRGLGPSYTVMQQEAMMAHFKGDMNAAVRYSALKEWAFAKGSKLFNNGALRRRMRMMIEETLDRTGSNNVSIDTIHRIKESIIAKGSSDLIDLKRQICVEIIKSRDPAYSVYKNPVVAEAEDMNDLDGIPSSVTNAPTPPFERHPPEDVLEAAQKE